MGVELLMNHEDRVIELLERHRIETRDEFDKLENTLSLLNSAMTHLATTTARMEERHAKADEEIRELRARNLEVGDRLRLVEDAILRQQSGVISGWKVLTILGGVSATLVTLAVAALTLIKG